MDQSTINLTAHFTGCASLAAIGMNLWKLDLLSPIRQLVQFRRRA